MSRIVAILLAALALASGCAGRGAQSSKSAGSTPATTTAEAPKFDLREEKQGEYTYVEYKPGKWVAVLPSASDKPLATVVILHGFNVETTFYHELAKAVADQDAVVLIPEWDDDLPSLEDSRQATVTDGLDDISDALRFTRLNAGRYGGDPERVILVGHSLGAAVGMTAMLAGDEFGSDAYPRDVSALPDGYVSLDGAVPFREQLWNVTLRELYDDDPDTWDKINPDTYLDESRVRENVTYRYFVAENDLDKTKSMAKRMKKLGFETKVSKLAVDHMQAAQPQPKTVKAISDLAHEGGR